MWTREDKRLRGAWLNRIQLFRVLSLEQRGRAAIAAAIQGQDVRALRVEVARAARQLSLENLCGAKGLSLLLRGCAALLQNDRDRSVRLLEAAMQHLSAAELGGFANATRFQLGTLIGGEKGEALKQEATDALFSLGASNPINLMRSLVPTLGLTG